MQYGEVIKQPGFAKLWLAQMFSATAQHLINFALIIRIYDLAQGTRFANIAVGLYVLSYGIPSVLFAQIAGVYVDRWDKRKVMLISNSLRMLVVLLYLIVDHNLVMVLIVSFIIATATQFFTPAEAASIPAVVDKAQLLQANSLFVLSFYATFVIGYSVSAPLILLLGARSIYPITSLMFAIAAGLSLLLEAIPATKKAADNLGEVAKTTVYELRQNWRTILGHHELYIPIIHLTLSQAVLGVILTLAPAIALALLAAPLTQVSHFLIIPAGLGMIVGTIGVGQLTARFSRVNVIRTSALFLTLSLVALGMLGRGAHPDRLTQHLIVAVIIFFMGVFNAVMTSMAQTLLQTRATPETLGKIYGVLNMLMNLAAALPVLVAAGLADLYGIPAVITAIGVVLGLGAVAQFIWPIENKQLKEA